ncbi:MAG: hypothetical protein QM809_08680 [Gordonia sp. (in: high G+C Gram-positive bacteria)]|uniref:hypothetical protein n=1 Tax=Gordonia sp. (in: high G+C Gram-positive bacteria) TaxID=84139 RepID=UPI0039E2AF50
MTVVSLRGVYDAMEKRATPVIEDVVRSPRFGEAAGVVAHLRRRVGRTVEGVAADLLHAVNLPAGSDLRKLRRQIGDLDFEVRSLRRELAERAAREDGDGTDS